MNNDVSHDFQQVHAMIQFDENKLAQLPITNQMLDEKFGTEGTASRTEFDAKALAWYWYDTTHVAIFRKMFGKSKKKIYLCG